VDGSSSAAALSWPAPTATATQRGSGTVAATGYGAA